jgi:hypothetical protein
MVYARSSPLAYGAGLVDATNWGEGVVAIMHFSAAQCTPQFPLCCRALGPALLGAPRPSEGRYRRCLSLSPLVPAQFSRKRRAEGWCVR